MSRYLLLVVLSIAVFAAKADCSGYQCQDVTITKLVVTTTGDVSISTSGDESALSCNAGSSGYIKLRKSVENFEEVYSLFLAFRIANKPLFIRTTEAGVCDVVYVVSTD